MVEGFAHIAFTIFKNITISTAPNLTLLAECCTVFEQLKWSNYTTIPVYLIFDGSLDKIDWVAVLDYVLGIEYFINLFGKSKFKL